MFAVNIVAHSCYPDAVSISSYITKPHFYSRQKSVSPSLFLLLSEVTELNSGQ